MSLPPRYFAQKLTEPLPTTDAGILRTIGDADAYMTALSKDRGLKQAWQHTARMIIQREPGEAITRQVSLALFTDAKLDFSHKSTRRNQSARKPGRGRPRLADWGHNESLSVHKRLSKHTK